MRTDGAGVGPRPMEEDATNRRDMLSLTTATLAITGLTGAAARLPDRIGPEHVEEVRRLTETYRGWAYQHGAGREVRAGISRLLDRTVTMLSEAGDAETRRGLCDATAELAGVAAYACRDLGAHDFAQQHYLLGVQAANAAGDKALAGHLLVRMAGHHIELTRPRQVLDYLALARRTERPTAAESTNQRSIEAWALAQAGDTQGVHRAVRMAEEDFGRARPPYGYGGPKWQVRHTSEAELYSLTGAAYVDLAHRDRRHAPEAIRRLNRSLELRRVGWGRGPTLNTVSLAEAHLLSGELDQAVDAADRAVRGAEESSSGRIRVCLTRLARRLEPHAKRPQVAETLHRIHLVTGGA